MRARLATLALAALTALPASAQPVNETLKLIASDPSNNATLGRSVAISGSTAIVGASTDAAQATNAGAAYLFDTATGQQLFKLISSDVEQNDFFGVSVAVSGTTAIVGAFGDDDGGSAYLFDTTTGQELFKLTASDAAVGDFFGYSVAISGTTAIVGAPRDADAGDSSGSAYLFDTTNGQQLFKLLPTGLSDGDLFGESVAIAGTTAIIGARGDNDTITDSGSAYIFDTTTGQLLFKLNASDPEFSDQFGSSVAIDGSIAIVGAEQDHAPQRDQGSAYIFNAATGLELTKFVASDASGSDRFGNSAAISGGTALVGAWMDDNSGFTNAGSAYTIDLTALDICPSDLDNSGATDLPDLNLVLSNFGMTTTTGDTNNDGVVDLADLNAVLGSFGAPCL